MSVLAECRMKWGEIFDKGRRPKKRSTLYRLYRAVFGDYVSDRCPRCGSLDVKVLTTEAAYGHEDNIACLTCVRTSAVYTTDY